MDKFTRSYTDRIAQLRSKYCTVEDTIKQINFISSISGNGTAINRIVVDCGSYTKVLCFPVGSYQNYTKLLAELLDQCNKLLKQYNQELLELMQEIQDNQFRVQSA